MSSTARNPSSGALGIGQWLGGRQSAMLASGAGANFNKQLAFVWQELQGSESQALSMLRNAKTLNQALLGAAQYERFNGYQSIGSGTEWGDRIGFTNEILGRRRSSAPATPTPSGTGSAGSGIPDATVAAKNYAAALQAAGSAMERLRALQAQLTNAQTASAFEEIAKALFPKVELEQYLDQLKETQLTYKAIKETSADA